MDIKTVFDLLRHLSTQTNTQDLTKALDELLLANFSGVEVVVYEVNSSRDHGSKEKVLIGLDILRFHPPINLNNSEAFFQAYESKQERHEKTALGRQRFVLPVELYDTSISHVVVAEHPYEKGGALELLTGLLRIFTDIFRNLHEKSYDPLTRILNRQAFDHFVANLAYTTEPAQKLGTNKKRYNVIAILDIDNFKLINDRFGHAIGDETLVLFSQGVRSVLRQDDMFFRYGGEEFVVFVKEVDYAQAQAVLERCRINIENRRFPQVGDVTVSVGVAYLEPGEHPGDTLSKADKALYYAKKNGRNQVLCYEQLVESGKLEPVTVPETKADFWD